MRAHSAFFLLVSAAPLGWADVAAAATPVEFAPTPQEQTLVQEVILDPSRPCFVPTHPRVTTTLRFPSPIGAPEGRGFVEDDRKQAGEYVVAWSQGDAHLTLCPLPGAGPLNLNIPFRGHTCVFYFYPVEQQFQAVACLTLRESETEGSHRAAATGPGSRGAPADTKTEPRRRQGAAPPRTVEEATPARLVGLLDRVRLLAAAPQPRELLQRATVMRLEVLSPGTMPQLPQREPPSTAAESDDLWRERDCGLFSLRLQLLAAERRLDCIAFVLEVANHSDRALGFNPSGFAARLGPRFLPALLSEGPSILAPNEKRVGFFIIRLPRDEPLALANPWSLSLELIAPRTNPGASLSKAFQSEAATRSPKVAGSCFP